MKLSEYLATIPDLTPIFLFYTQIRVNDLHYFLFSEVRSHCKESAQKEAFELALQQISTVDDLLGETTFVGQQAGFNIKITPPGELVAASSLKDWLKTD